jgi:predicted metal-dependent hydrolase
MGKDYRIIFSRRKSIGIVIRPDKEVVVRAPYGASIKVIEKFVREKEAWIKKHIEKYSDTIQLNSNKKYVDGEKYLFLGRELTLRIKNSLFPSIKQTDNILEVETDGKEGRVKILIDRWYRKKAEEIFSEKLNEILIKHKEQDFSPSQLVVRSLKSRWGSCTSKGKITISSDLVKLDERFIEYVIIHELCHLRHHNHGKDYYRLLERLVPDYQVIRKDLRKYITR